MNVYQVVSEPIEYQDIIDPEIGGPWESYCIAELVAAPNRGRAKWLAWQSDGDFRKNGPGIGDMPKFSVKLVRKGEDWPEGVLGGMEHLWAWGLKHPWTLPEVRLVENYLDKWGEATHEDESHEQV